MQKTIFFLHPLLLLTFSAFADPLSSGSHPPSSRIVRIAAHRQAKAATRAAAQAKAAQKSQLVSVHAELFFENGVIS